MYIYTRVKEAGTTPKRCHSKGLWDTNNMGGDFDSGVKL